MNIEYELESKGYGVFNVIHKGECVAIVTSDGQWFRCKGNENGVIIEVRRSMLQSSVFVYLNLLTHMREESKKSEINTLKFECKKLAETKVCPVCGSNLIIPNQDFDKVRKGNLDTYLLVYCSEMGHWAGNISECNDKEDK